MSSSLGRTTFQTKFFLAALSAAVIALGVAGALFATTMRGQIDELAPVLDASVLTTSSAARRVGATSRIS